MKFLENRKGIITHPAGMFVIALILGMVLAYVWIHYVSVPNPFCTK